MIHYQVAAKKLAFEDRIRYLEDPKFGDPKIAMLISKEHAAKRRELVGEIMNRPAQTVANQSSDTTYLCATDRDGNAISFIQSVFAPFGSRVIAGDTGVIMNNRLCSFGLDPSKANALKPGKRPAHTLNTYMVFRGNEVFAVGGSPGRGRAAADQFSNHPRSGRFADGPAERRRSAALEPPAGHAAAGSTTRGLRMEDGFDPATLDGLRKKGHKISVVDRWSFGSAKVIVRDRRKRLLARRCRSAPSRLRVLATEKILQP